MTLSHTGLRDTTQNHSLRAETPLSTIRTARTAIRARRDRRRRPGLDQWCRETTLQRSIEVRSAEEDRRRGGVR